MNSQQAATGVREIEAGAARAWIDSGEAVLIDVREADEHAKDRIPGATLAPLSRFAAGDLPDDGRRLVFHCRSGRRSMDAAGRAVNAGRAEAFSLKGGILAWKAAGLPVVENRGAPISLMRQVQITIGVLLLAGSSLAALSPWFLIVPGFIGAGQLFAGLSGTCGLAALLAMAPWNRAVGAGHA